MRSNLTTCKLTIIDPRNPMLGDRPNRRLVPSPGWEYLQKLDTLQGHVMSHGEFHRSQRGGWLRAGVLGANDGLISTSSLVVAMVGAGAVTQTILVAGLSGLIAGALSMAAGEYVSVSSQADAENADEEKERGELLSQPDAELLELTTIYEKRGLTRRLAEEVARELTAHDALSAHLRDELGIHDVLKARPLQAAFASAISFFVGALPPVLLAATLAHSKLAGVVVVTTLCVLAALGAVAARLGGASQLRGALRVVVWGAIAMAATYAIGAWFGVLTAP